MAIKTVETSIPITDAQNKALASGSITLDLSQPAIIASGGGDVVPLRVILPLDSTGKIANQPVNLWANDQLSPTGTTYEMRVFNSNGLLVADWGQLSIVGSAPIDLSQLTPSLSSPSLSVTNVPFVVARADLTGQNANLGFTTLYTTPVAGIYAFSFYIVVTTAAGVSSTLPAVSVAWTDAETSSSNSSTISATNTGNTSGAFGQMTASQLPPFAVSFNAKAGTAIQYATGSYASSPASTMIYSLHLRLVYLG